VSLRRSLRFAGLPKSFGMGIGMSAVVGCVFVAVALALAAPASADYRFGTSGKEAGQLAGVPGGLALNAKEGSNVFIPDDYPNSRVDVFQPSGQFVRAFGFSVDLGAAQGTANLIGGQEIVSEVTTTSGAFFVGQVVTGTGIQPGTKIVYLNGFEPFTNTELRLSKPATVTASGVILTAAAFPGNVPTNERQRLTVQAAGGTFTLTFTSPRPGSTTETTAPLTVNASESKPTTAEVQSALEALSNIGSGAVSVSGGPADEKGTHPYEIEFKGRYADVNVRELSAEDVSLNGGNPSSSVTVTTVQEGATALETCTTLCTGGSPEGAGPGQLFGPDALAVDNDATSPTYGDVYVIDQQDYRVERFSPTGEFQLMFGGEVDKTKVKQREEEEAHSEPVTVTAEEEDVCTAAEVAGGDQCGAGVPGTGPSHFHEGQWNYRSFNSIAVGPNGRVYVGDYGRVQEFSPAGAYLGQLTLADSEPQYVIALAVAPPGAPNEGDIFERSATPTEEGPSEIPGVREYDSSHNYLRTFDAGSGSFPNKLAIDAAGDLFLTHGIGSNLTLRGYRPDGALYLVTSSELVEGFDESSAIIPGGIAVDGPGDTLYVTTNRPEGSHVAVVSVPSEGPPVVSEEHVDAIQPTTATLHGVVNPSGFATEYFFQYITKENFEADGNSYGTGTEQTSVGNLSSVIQKDPVLASISLLEPATTYHYRLVAKNHCNESNPSEVCTTNGADETFETLPPVTIRDFTTQRVAPEEVTLKAELNPNGKASTYTIRYGTDAGYDCEQGNTCKTSGNLTVGNEFVKVESEGKEGVTFTGLEPNTEYHYQISVENEYGHFSTPDRTFTTEPSSAEERAAEDCPENGTVHGEVHSTLREENNSVALPDCRAYEKTTATHKEGGEAFPGFSLARGGERVGYSSEGAFAGAESNPLATQYLAQRTSTGWVTTATVRHLLPPPIEPLTTLLFTPELDHWLFYEAHGHSVEEAGSAQTSAFFSMGSADGSYVAQASPVLAPVEGNPRFIFRFMNVGGYSNDMSRIFIPTRARLLSSPEDERTENGDGTPDRIYEVAGTGGPAPTLRLAAEVPLGLTATQQGLSEGGCFINDEHAIGRHPYGVVRITDEAGTLLVYASPLELVEGGRCGPGNPNPYAILASSGGNPPVQVNAPFDCTSPHPCSTAGTANPLYDGVSADGRYVWFTTTQPLVNADADSTNDLYVAKLSPAGQVEELSLASAGKAAPTHPNPGEGALVGESGLSETANQGVVRISADGTHAAFESPAVLTETPNALGQSPVQHANNLYMYDATTNETKFVAELCSGPGISGTEPAGSQPQSSYSVSLKNGVADPACPSTVESFTDGNGENRANDDKLWLPNATGGEAAITSNGNSLLFASYGRLTEDDTDNAQDLYRYDFETGALIRISKGRNGNDGNGNDNRFPAELAGNSGFSDLDPFAEAASRPISADGSTVIFRTAGPLVSRDTNEGINPDCVHNEGTTGCDIYEWEEDGHGTCTEAGGCVRLVSSGLDPHGDKTAIISSSGRDVAFFTLRNLIPEDTDGVGDIYDARVNGGFHTPHPPPPCTSPEACGEGFTSEPPLPRLSTPTFVGPGNATTQLKCARGRHRVSKHGKVVCVPNRRRKPGHNHKKHHRRAATKRGAGR
jgi:hypothetical protein